MSSVGGVQGEGFARGLRVWMWLAAALLWLAPAVAMRFTTEVRWEGPDFALFGLMLLLACGSIELAARSRPSAAYLLATAVAVAAAFLSAWANLAVGILGEPDDPANRVFFGVLLLGMAAAALARFRPPGLVLALRLMAVAQAAAALLPLLAGELLAAVFSGFLAFAWLASGELFGRAASTSGT